MRRFEGRPSPALIVSIVALIVAVGGTSYAATALPANSVGTRQLKNGAVKTKKIKDGAVTTGKLANGAVTTAKLANGAVTTNKIADGSVTGPKVNLSTLGTVPSANHARSAGSPASLGHGRTMRGVYVANIPNAGAAGEVQRAPQSFLFELPAALPPTHTHFIREGEAPPAECPGSVSDPAATPMNLCVYESASVHISAAIVSDPVTGTAGASRFGFYIRITASAPGTALSYGTWAVSGPPAMETMTGATRRH